MSYIKFLREAPGSCYLAGAMNDAFTAAEKSDLLAKLQPLCPASPAQMFTLEINLANLRGLREPGDYVRCHELPSSRPVSRRAHSNTSRSASRACSCATSSASTTSGT